MALMSWILIVVLTCLVALVALSYIVEALRPVPKRPDILVWAPRIPIHYVDLGGIRVRCIKTGVGPNLVLLHTLRTQLDIFEKIIPGLEQHFTVHAFDYPGHGWSDIPNAAYAPKDFHQWTAAYLDKLDIRRAAIVGSLNRRNVLADAGGASESARREGHRRQSLRLLAGRRHSQELSRRQARLHAFGRACPRRDHHALAQPIRLRSDLRRRLRIARRPARRACERILQSRRAPGS